MKTATAILATAVALSSTGCMHRPLPHLPEPWQPREASWDSVVDDPEQARLHVFIVYAPLNCSHTALRLNGPTVGVVFWDPGGGFGLEGHVKARRRADLVVTGTPTVAAYLDWRERVPTSHVEIFEFRVSDEEATELAHVLRHGSVRKDPEKHFNTETAGGACAVAVSDFLARFAEDVAEVESIFFPHDLADQLYDQQPDRVLVYRDGTLVEFAPPSRVVRNETGE